MRWWGFNGHNSESNISQNWCRSHQNLEVGDNIFHLDSSAWGPLYVWLVLAVAYPILWVYQEPPQSAFPCLLHAANHQWKHCQMHETPLTFCNLWYSDENGMSSDAWLKEMVHSVCRGAPYITTDWHLPYVHLNLFWSICFFLWRQDYSSWMIPSQA